MAPGWVRIPAVAAAAGVPVLLAGMLVAPSPDLRVGLRSDTVRTSLADPAPVPETGDLTQDGAHPATDPGPVLLDVRLETGAQYDSGDGTERTDRNRGVPVRVTGTALPARVLLAYRNAAASMRRSDPGCHLQWSLVAAIGKVESGHAFGGRVDRGGHTLTPILGPVLDGAGPFAAIPDSDGGRWDGDTTWDRAVGPMQFIPSSWAAWGQDADGDGTADPSDVDDAALATAAYLCAGDRDLQGEGPPQRGVQLQPLLGLRRPGAGLGRRVRHRVVGDRHPRRARRPAGRRHDSSRRRRHHRGARPAGARPACRPGHRRPGPCAGCRAACAGPAARRRTAGAGPGCSARRARPDPGRSAPDAGGADSDTRPSRRPAVLPGPGTGPDRHAGPDGHP